MKRTQTLKVNHLSKNCVIIAEDTDTILPNVDKNNKIIRINLKSTEPNKSFYQYMKKDQNLPNKNIHSNNSSGKPLPGNSNYSRNQSPFNSSYRGRSPEQRNSRNSSQNRLVDQIVKTINIEIIIHDRIQTEMFLIPIPNHTEGIDTIPTIDHEIHHTIKIETILTIGMEVNQTIEIRTIQTTDQETIHTLDQTIKDPMITTKTDHDIIHRTETQAITIDTEIIPNLNIGIIAVTPILNIDTEAKHQSIKYKLIKYIQMKNNFRIARY